jgi:hypothetical protein
VSTEIRNSFAFANRGPAVYLRLRSNSRLLHMRR